ncbi:TPA: hypothetical protein ACOTG0_002085 [Clostridium perfringens]|nr:hypothetical protein phiCPD_00092 [Clostridium phage phiCp-D]
MSKVDELKRKSVLEYAMAVSFLVDNIECLIEDYKSEEELSEEQLEYTEIRIAKVKEYEKNIKKILGIEG